MLRTLILALSLLSASLANATSVDLMTRSTADALPDSLYNSGHPDLTPDGRYVVFESSQTGLVTPATNGLTQIFLRDRTLGTTELVSKNDAGVQGDAASYHPSISDDGCFIVFHTRATNLDSPASDGNGLDDVYIHNRCGSPDQTFRISVNQSGVPLTTASTSPDISGDGLFVAFDNDGDIRRYSTIAGLSELVAHGSFASREPAISADGTRIAFWSFASDLVAQDGNGVWDIFLWDAAGPTIQLVSTTQNGTQQAQGNEGTSTIAAPGLSADGKFVAFRSRTNNLISGLDDGLSHVYVKNLDTGAILQADVSTSGESGNADSSGSSAGSRPAISADGKWVAFVTNATNLTGDTGGTTPNVVAHNMLTGDTVGFTTTNSDDVPAIAGPHGRFLAFFSTGHLDARFDSSGVFLHDRWTPPVADAGPDQTSAPNTEVTLDGSGSHASANPFVAPDTLPITTYTWSQLEGPVAVTLSDPHAVMPTFTPTQIGTYRFGLIVADDIGSSAQDEVTIEVQDPTTPRVTVVTPNGGEAWTLGSKVTISWEITNVVLKKKAKVILALTPDGGDTLLVIGRKPARKGSVLWKIPKKAKFVSDQMLLAVCLPGTKKPPTDPVCDTSDAVFSIAP